jgi:hypothetical protein
MFREENPGWLIRPSALGETNPKINVRSGRRGRPPYTLLTYQRDALFENIDCDISFVFADHQRR